MDNAHSRLMIYDTLQAKKCAFVAHQDRRVGVYVCGMTVYDFCHLGHGRVMVVFDVVVRVLKFLGYDVTYVRNITDIDDKIIKRAVDEGVEFTAVTERFIQEMRTDEAALGIEVPDHTPQATEFIDQMIQMIQALEEKGIAYETDGGDVCFDVTQFEGYGRLSKRKLDEQVAGARVGVADDKRHPEDFVLWKTAKPGEPAWPSPWGNGRPGWHIECSAMSSALLGLPIDIHGGGIDLCFPHHENELAQSEAAQQTQMVNTWMHAGHVMVNQEKMSKSLGNFMTLREVMKTVSADTLRLFYLMSHYRSPVDFEQQGLDSAKRSAERLFAPVQIHWAACQAGEVDRAHPEVQRFVDALCDDFNTPQALSVLFELAKASNRARDAGNDATAEALAVQLCALGSVLGLFQPGAQTVSGAESEILSISEEQIESAIHARQVAREAKDWAEADRVRDALLAQGVRLIDGPTGTTWEAV